MDLDFVSVHKNAKRELDQYPAILTSRLVNNIYFSVCAGAVIGQFCGPYSNVRPATLVSFPFPRA